MAATATTGTEQQQLTCPPVHMPPHAMDADSTALNLWEQAGVQAGIPVNVRQRGPDLVKSIATLPGSSADSLVLIDSLAAGTSATVPDALSALCRVSCCPPQQATMQYMGAVSAFCLPNTLATTCTWDFLTETLQFTLFVVSEYPLLHDAYCCCCCCRRQAACWCPVERSSSYSGSARAVCSRRAAGHWCPC
jgi:hypothetical protein